MKLNRATYKDKVKACWIGKNIGGTIGGPYEGKREILDVKSFITESGEPMPNDDLDLQLIWLHAVEKEGAKNIRAEVLGEYWLSFIAAAPSEYGICQANMRARAYPAAFGRCRKQCVEALKRRVDKDGNMGDARSRYARRCRSLCD